jgi:VWFA-related protein
MKPPTGTAMIVAAAVITAGQIRPAATQSFRQPFSKPVPVVATVTDRSGRPVAGLGPDAFQVVEHGHTQPITSFAGAGTPPVSIVLALDEGSTPRIDLQRLREAAGAFVVGLRAQDQAQLCSFGNTVQCGGSFTNNSRVLVNELSEIRSRDGARLFDAIDAGIARLEKVNGRRVVVVFTGAPDTDSRINPATVLAHAQAASAMVYAIGIDLRFFDGDDFVDGKPDPELETLARETGGKYLELEHWKELPAAFNRVRAELKSQYAFTFEPSAADNRGHSIKVRLTVPTLRIRARHSYRAGGR